MAGGPSHLATRILSSSRSFGPLFALQQEAALIPLELALAAQPQPDICTPTDWVTQVDSGASAPQRHFPRNEPRC